MSVLNALTARLHAEQTVGLLTMGGTVTLVLAVAVLFGLTTGIRALYLVFGCALFLAGVASTNRLEINTTANRVSKLLVTVAAVTLVTSYLVGRVAGLVVSVLALSTLVWTIVFCDFPPRRHLAHVSVSFVAVTVSKFVATNAYFGNGDIFGHRRAVSQLITGGPSTITRGVYADFPGLHATAAAIRLVTGLSPYVSLLTVGMVVMSLSVLVVYLFYERYLPVPEVAVVAVLLYATFEQTTFYATYVFPQTLAFVFGLLLLVTLTNVQRDSTVWRHPLLASLFVGAFVVTHHFTLVLFAPVIGALVLTDIIKIIRGEFRLGTAVRGVGLSVWLCVAVVYWRSTEWGLDAVTWAVNRLPIAGVVGLSEVLTDSTGSTTPTDTPPQTATSTPVPTDTPSQTATSTPVPTDTPPQTATSTPVPTDTPPQTATPTDTPTPAGLSELSSVVRGPPADFAFDVSVVTDTVERALLALVEPTLVYQAALVTLVVLGVLILGRDYTGIDTDRVLLLLLSVGGLSLLIKTPVQPKGIGRAQMVWAVFAAVVPAVGAGRIVAERSSVSFDRVVLAVVLTLAVVAGPLAAADDTTAIQPSVDRNKEVELAHDNRQLRAVAAFGSRTGVVLSGPWVTRMAIKWNGSPAGTVVATDEGLRPESSLLIVRERWGTQIVKLTQGDSIVLKNAYFSRDSVEHAERDGQKVYTAGDVSILFARNETVAFGGSE